MNGVIDLNENISAMVGEGFRFEDEKSYLTLSLADDFDDSSITLEEEEADKLIKFWHMHKRSMK